MERRIVGRRGGRVTGRSGRRRDDDPGTATTELMTSH
jgi:hypothetical protein